MWCWAATCTIGDFVVFGGQAAVRQFVRIGEGAMVVGLSGVRADVIPFGLVQGPLADLIGLNVVGMRRRGSSKADIHRLRQAYEAMFFGAGTFRERLDAVAARSRATVHSSSQSDRLHPRGLATADHGHPPRAGRRGHMSEPSAARMPEDSPLAIISGGGSLPFTVADAAGKRGRRVVLFAIRGWADPQRVAGYPHHWMGFGQFGRFCHLAHQEGCRDVVLIGSVVRPAILADQAGFQDAPAAAADFWPCFAAATIICSPGSRESSRSTAFGSSARTKSRRKS